MYKKRRKRDYDIYKNNHSLTPKQVVTVSDLGYLGLEKDYPDQLSALPCKKKYQEGWLSREVKENNKSHSKKRIVIEHTICKLKKYRIVAQMYLETN